MSERDLYLSEIYGEAERVYPEFVRPKVPKRSWWSPVSPGRDCPKCGTRIFLLEDGVGERRWHQIGRVDPEPPAGTQDRVLRLSAHGGEKCRELEALHGSMSVTAAVRRPGIEVES